MSNRLTRLFSRTPGQRRFTLAAAITGALVVPLAVAGFVAGGLASAGDRVDQIPAMIVNNDTMVTSQAPDGSEQQVLAGRLLVTQLTKKTQNGFDWQLSNTKEADQALADGRAYAVLTIPKDFSAAITSLSGPAPTQADLGIRTDDSHAYLAGSVAQSIGDAMSGAFGRQITQQYLSGFYANLAGMGNSLSSAADGAAQLSSGAASLTSGLNQLSGGVASAASGAHQSADGAARYADGVGQYTRGVDSLAAGAGQLNSGTASLPALVDGVRQYTGAVSGIAAQASGALAQLNALVAANPEIVQQYPQLQGYLDQVNAAGGGLSQFAAGGDQLAEQTAGAVSSLRSGISSLADGAAQLSSGSAALRDGAAGLASGNAQLATGLDELASGASASATGAGSLTTGADSLAAGLGEGAKQAGKLGDIDAAKTAKVVSDPVAVSANRENAIASPNEVIGMVLVPVGLWIGALVIFLLLRPISRIALQSTASTPQLVVRSLGRAALIAAGQAVLVVLLLHAALGVAWSLLPATLAFALFTALVFVALHHFLTVAFRRWGVVASLLLVILQVLASGALYPVQLLSGPFQLIGPFLPLTWAVHGMQLIISGVGGGGVAAAAAVLALFGIIAIAGSLFVVARRRGAKSWGFALGRG